METQLPNRVSGTASGREAPLRVRLLGALDLRLGDAPVRLDSGRAESLLAYLLVHRDAPQPRQRLAFLLWPDSTEPQARTNLRHVLHTLRRAFPTLERFVEVTPRTLRWRPEAPLELDVARFEAALVAASGGGDEAAALREAVDAYTGDLLAGSYDEWLLEHRDRLRHRYLEALGRLATLLEARGEPAEAIAHAERLLAEDPLREETYRLLMRCHDARADRSRAVRVFHACAAVLERELGVEPSPATRDAYEALLPRGELAEEARRAPGRHLLVGRAAERARLTSLWREAARGRAQLALVTGEPGIGKSRLLDELRAWCEHRGAVAAVARAYAAEGALAYAPVAAWLRAGRIAACRPRLPPRVLAEVGRLLPEVAEADGAEREQAEHELDRRQRLFDGVARALLAVDAPLLLVADDLQWFDRETLQFLHYLLRSEPDARLLVAAGARLEDVEPSGPLEELLLGLRALDRLSEVPLERLSRDETELLAERMTGGALGGDAAARLFAETEGNPLFVVEAVRAGWQADDDARDHLSARVHAVIESRLSRLSTPARELAGLAATIGREFGSELLAAAAGAGEEELVSALDELWRRRIVREHGAEAYDFTHDRIREAAYASLSPARRRRHHLAVAGALEQLHAADRRPVSGRLASHYDLAGAAREAISWYAAAAEEAKRVYAVADAVAALRRALALLSRLAASRERDETELELLTALLAPLAALEGSAARALLEAQRRALHLTNALVAEPTPPLLRSVAVTALSRGQLEQARDAGRQLELRGERDGDELALVESRYVLGISAYWQGELRAARRHFETAVARYRREYRPTHVAEYGLDPKAICSSRLANTLWFLGFPDSAREGRAAALALAEDVGHPATHATVLVFAVQLALELREPAEVEWYARLLRETSDDTFANARSADAFEAYLDVVAGRREDGLGRLRTAVEETRAAGPAPGIHAFMARLLLEACREAGEFELGLATADARLRPSAGASLWEAEVRRLRAEFLAALGGAPEEVEAELARALAVAGRQGAASLALRAATTLVRTRAERGDEAGAETARARLAAALAALAEPARTRDREDAETLLATS